MGAAHGAVAAINQHPINLRIAGPAAYPTTTFGMEATTYPKQGFDGLIQLRLTVSKDRQDALGHRIQYSTAAEVRVAPWMMPNHLDEAQRVYVVNLGPDVMSAGGFLSSGNQTFRNALGIHVNAAGIVGGNFVQYLPAAPGAVTAYNRATARAPGDHSLAHAIAREEAFFELLNQALAGNLAPVLTAAQVPNVRADHALAPAAISNAATDAADAAEAALVAEGAVVTARADIITDATNAINALGAPFNAGGVAAAVGEAAADGAAAEAGKRAPADTTNGFDSHGNLECTPPCQATAAAAAVAGIAAGPKAYPWGRIYYGRGLVGAGQPFNTATRQFLEKQRVQLPIAINTDWLFVGHVDEMMSFIPVPGGPPYKQWKLLLASPRRAYQLLLGTPHATPVLQNRDLDMGNGWVPVNTTVGDMVGAGGAGASYIPNPAGAGNLTWTQLMNFNLGTIQPQIDATRDQLVDEIGLIAPGKFGFRS